MLALNLNKCISERERARLVLSSCANMNKWYIKWDAGKKTPATKAKKKWKKAARTTVNANALQCAAHNDSKVDTALLYWLKQNSPNAYGLANNKKKVATLFCHCYYSFFFTLRCAGLFSLFLNEISVIISMLFALCKRHSLHSTSSTYWSVYNDVWRLKWLQHSPHFIHINALESYK